MGEPLVRTEIDKENNSSLNNSASINNRLKSTNSSSGKRCLINLDKEISKKVKINQTESIPTTIMASGFKNNGSNKPRTSNLSQGNRRFENGSARPRLGIQYLDDDSDDLDQPHHRVNGDQYWKSKDRSEASSSKETSKSSKNLPQKNLLPQISPQPSTSGETFNPRSKDQRNLENKKRALSLNKKQNGVTHTSDFSSDAEDLSNIAPTTSKAQTKNGRKNTVPTRNHSFNGHSNTHRDNLDSLTESDSAQHTVLPRNFRSPVHKRSSQNVADRRTNGETSNANNHSSLEEGFFRRPRIAVERYRGSPPRNPPHHRRQANGRNDGSFFRNLVQSNPGLFDTEEDESVIDITRSTPSLRSNQGRRTVDNRELEENLSRNRRFNQGFSPDHQPRRRNNNRVPRQNHDRQSRVRYTSPSRRTVSSPSRRTVASPDTAERVRQIQEDEDLARILQAEFDAEAETVAFHIHDEDDSDDSSINGIFENNNFDEDAAGTRGIGVDSTSSSEVEEVDVVGSFYRAPHIYRNGGYHQFAGSMPIVRSRGRRGRPRTSRANTMFHLHDLFGWAVGVDFLAENEDNSSDDYEMLWNLTERLGEVVPRGMDKREINRLPTRKFTQSSRNNNYQSGSSTSSQTPSTPIKECQVCLSEFENNEILRILPCFHEFHATCIDRWLKNNNTCPVCRAEVNGVNSE